MPVAVADKGLKRICPSCGTRYYDFNKRPVNCPGCAVEFTGELKLKARRGRVVPEEEAKPVAVKEVVVEEVAAEDDTVSLDDVEAIEEGAADDDLDAVLDDDIDDIEDLEEELEEEAEGDKA